jgi:hypothetical protein
MLKRKILMTIAAMVIIAGMAMAQSVWDGTSDVIWYNTNKAKDTLYVSNGQELTGMSQLVSSAITTFAGKTIILSSNINLGNRSWTPIGNSTTAQMFQGVFDGNGKTISNLLVSSATYAGLFGYVGANGQIKNITVGVKSVRGSSYAGGLSGYYASKKTIENCGVNITDSIYSSNRSGGLVGFASIIGLEISN